MKTKLTYVMTTRNFKGIVNTNVLTINCILKAPVQQLLEKPVFSPTALWAVHTTPATQLTALLPLGVQLKLMHTDFIYQIRQISMQFLLFTGSYF